MRVAARRSTPLALTPLALTRLATRLAGCCCMLMLADTDNRSASDSRAVSLLAQDAPFPAVAIDISKQRLAKTRGRRLSVWVAVGAGTMDAGVATPVQPLPDNGVLWWRASPSSTVALYEALDDAFNAAALHISVHTVLLRRQWHVRNTSLGKVPARRAFDCVVSFLFARCSLFQCIN